MAVIFVRTLIVYLLLVVSIRIMGKRQLGEMELSELIVAALTANLAANSLQDLSTPFLYGLVPIAVLNCCELLISGFALKSVRLRGFLYGEPSLLIDHGVIDQQEMAKNRFTLDELMAELRGLGVRSLASVEYAYLETDGTLSVLQFQGVEPPGAEKLGLGSESCGYPRVIISDGRIIEANLERSGHDMKWLREQLGPYGGDASRVFLMTVDDLQRVYFSMKEAGK